MQSLSVKKFKSLLFVSSIEMVLGVAALLADTVIAGYLSNGSTENSIAAINLMAPLIAVMVLVADILSKGVQIYYDTAIGEENEKHADEIFGMGLLCSVVVGIIISIIITNGLEWYLDFLNPNDKIKYYVHEYFRYFKFVLLITPLFTILNVMVYNDGDEIISNLANQMNIVGNIIFSIIFAFYFKMGIAGIALGTLVKEILSIIILLCHFLKKNNSLHAKAYFNFKDFIGFINLGFVDSGMFLMWSILSFITNKFVIVYYGSFYLPVLSIAFSMLEISVIFDGIAQAMLPLVTVYHAEGNFTAVRKIMKSATKISLIEGAVFTIILFIFSEHIAYAFDIDNPELVKLCSTAVRIIASTFTISSVLYLFETYYMITAKNIIAVISSFLRNLIFVLLISIPLGMTGNMNGIWAGFAIAQIFTLMSCNALMEKLYSRDEFPLYLGTDKKILDIDVKLSQKNIIDVRDKAEKFLLNNGISRNITNKIMLIIEESGMLTLEKNSDKKVLAEYTLIIDEKQNIQFITRDNGEIFNITDTDGEITSFRGFTTSVIMNNLRNRKNSVTTNLNRNFFSFSES